MKNMKVYILHVICAIFILSLLLLVYIIFSDIKGLDFAGISFERSIPGCTEIIKFKKNRQISYYEVCGNPVSNFDECEKYNYNKITKEIIVDCRKKEKFKIIEYKKNSHLTLEYKDKKLFFKISK